MTCKESLINNLLHKPNIYCRMLQGSESDSLVILTILHTFFFTQQGSTIDAFQFD